MRNLDKYMGNAVPQDYRTGVRWHVPDRPVALPRPPARSKKRRWWIWPVVALLVAALGAYGYLALGPGSSPESAGLGLSVEGEGNDLIMTWNAKAPAVADAQNGILSIVDGNYKKDTNLSAVQLRAGRIFYSPDTSDVSFQLELVTSRHGRVSESVRVLGESRDMPDRLAKHSRTPALPVEPSLPRPEPERTARRERNVDEPPVHASVPPRENVSEVRRPAPPPFRVPALPAPKPVLVPPPVQSPVQVASRTLIPQPLPPPPPVVKPAPPASVSSQPAPVMTSSLANSAPAPASTYGYVAPRLVRQVSPSVPQSMRTFITHDFDVELMVSIDARGKVSHVDALSAPNPYLSNLAASTVGQWRFEPAKLNNRNVPSQMKLVFRFRSSNK